VAVTLAGIMSVQVQCLHYTKFKSLQLIDSHVSSGKMTPLNKSDWCHHNTKKIYPSKKENKSKFKIQKTYFTFLSIMAVSKAGFSVQNYVFQKM
jgi:hypothetical protein